MDITFNRPTIYVSHPIRGTSGNMKLNCQKAITSWKKMQAIFPEVDFYLPASGDLMPQVLWNNGHVSTEAILESDLEILRACHGYVYLKYEDSEGSNCELAEAQKLGLTVGNEDVIRDDLGRANYGQVRRRLMDVVEAAVERYRRSK